MADTKKEFITSNDEHWYPSPSKKEVWYPSVTTIIGATFPKGVGFQKYLANLSSYEESQTILKDAGRRGTNVHEGTELLERGETLHRDNYTLEEWQMLEGFVKWWKKYQPEVLAVERSLCSDKLKTGGTIDRVYIINGVLTILDIKTSSAIHDNYWAQTAAYDALWFEHEKQRVEQTAILRLAPKRKEGYEYVCHSRKEIDKDFKVFKSVYTVWEYLNPKAGPKLLDVPTELSLK